MKLDSCHFPAIQSNCCGTKHFLFCSPLINRASLYALESTLRVWVQLTSSCLTQEMHVSVPESSLKQVIYNQLLTLFSSLNFTDEINQLKYFTVCLLLLLIAGSLNTNLMSHLKSWANVQRYILKDRICISKISKEFSMALLLNFCLWRSLWKEKNTHNISVVAFPVCHQHFSCASNSVWWFMSLNVTLDSVWGANGNVS